MRQVDQELMTRLFGGEKDAEAQQCRQNLRKKMPMREEKATACPFKILLAL